MNLTPGLRAVGKGGGGGRGTKGISSKLKADLPRAFLSYQKPANAKIKQKEVSSSAGSVFIRDVSLRPAVHQRAQKQMHDAIKKRDT